jgi:hypothetical protein
MHIVNRSLRTKATSLAFFVTHTISIFKSEYLVCKSYINPPFKKIQAQCTLLTDLCPLVRRCGLDSKAHRSLELTELIQRTSVSSSDLCAFESKPHLRTRGQRSVNNVHIYLSGMGGLYSFCRPGIHSWKLRLYEWQRKQGKHSYNLNFQEWIPGLQKLYKPPIPLR